MTDLVQTTLNLIMNAYLNKIENETTHTISVNEAIEFYCDESELNDK